MVMDNLAKSNLIASLEKAIKDQEITVDNAIHMKHYLQSLLKKLKIELNCA
jgi:hypothetical protein